MGTNSESVTDLKKEFSLPDICKFYRNGKVLEDQDVFAHDDTIEIIAGGLPGGKGGFGSMLRALGNQIQKTTNKEACRDLSGRRLRDINEEKRLKKYVAKKAEREQIEVEKKDAKMKKLHKLVTEGESKHEFKDEKYDKAREEATDRVHEALDQVFSDPDMKPGPSGVKRKAEEEKKKSEPLAKKRFVDRWR